MDLERQLEGYRQANERNESLVGCALLLLVLTVALVRFNPETSQFRNAGDGE